MPDIIPPTCECCHDHICRHFSNLIIHVCSWRRNGQAGLLHLCLIAQKRRLEYSACRRIVSELHQQRVHADLFPLPRWFVQRRSASTLYYHFIMCVHTLGCNSGMGFEALVSLTHTLYIFLIACRGATPRDHRILPRRIILVRHAESEGNIDNFAYTYVPDPQVPLVSNVLAIARLCTPARSTAAWTTHGACVRLYVC